MPDEFLRALLWWSHRELIHDEVDVDKHLPDQLLA
jgi:hypothetical protein